MTSAQLDVPAHFCNHRNVEISFDPAKCEKAVAERGLNFADAAEVFEGVTIDIPDRRRDYGEDRTVSVGFLRGRMVVVVWARRGEGRRIISMRKANERERERYGQQF